jgi:hypothetical protein
MVYLVQKFAANECFEVTMAADGPAFDLLKSALPEIPIIRFPGPVVRYGRKGPAWLFLVRSFPKFLVNLHKEHAYLKKIVKDKKFDLVISDNRYGLYYRRCTTIFLTHQLRVPFPGFLKWMEPLGQRIHYRFIRRFDFCWIPDLPGPESIGGRLSHPERKPPNTHYIGLISRFMGIIPKPAPEPKTDIVVLLSGPEPQRTILESELIKRLEHRPESVLMVRGLPGCEPTDSMHRNIRLVTHMPASRLKAFLVHSKHIICRAGYSSIMDLLVLGRTAIIIPTPGQPEQEYLASYLHSKKYFYRLPQSNLDLERAFEGTNTCRGMKIPYRDEWLDRAMQLALKKNT